MNKATVLTALYVANLRIVELIEKTDTSNQAEVMLLLRDKMTIDEAIKELKDGE